MIEVLSLVPHNREAWWDTGVLDHGIVEWTISAEELGIAQEGRFMVSANEANI